MLQDCRTVTEPAGAGLPVVPGMKSDPRTRTHYNPSEDSETGKDLIGLYRRFVLTAIFITLTFGTFWGVSILTKAATTRSFGAPDPASIQAHAHAQVFGWIGLLIMGVAYFVFPKLKNVKVTNLSLISASYWLMAGGIFTRAMCQPFAQHSLAGAAVAASGLSELIAAVIFASVMVRTLRRSAQMLHVSDVFMLISAGWLLVALAINFYSMIEILRSGKPIIAELWNLRRMNVEVFGFIITMIFGVGIRIIPRLLSLPEMRFNIGLAAAVIYTLGVAIKAFSGREVLGSLLITIAATLYLAELKPFKSVANSTGDHLRLWVRTAFVWLVASALMMLGGDVYASLTGTPAPHAWVGAYRHAVTVGFITMLAVGVALRTAPLFHGTTLYSRKLVTATFWLLATGNACRVIFQILTLTQHPVAYAVAGMSGYLELAALILFGLNIVKTLSKPGAPQLRENSSRLLFHASASAA